MGLDLRLLPLDHDDSAWGFSHTILNVQGARDIYTLLMGVTRTAPPKMFSTYAAILANGERGYGRHTVTAYGDPLMCVTVGHLLSNCRLTLAGLSPAVYAYLQALDGNTRVALDWH